MSTLKRPEVLALLAAALGIAAWALLRGDGQQAGQTTPKDNPAILARKVERDYSHARLTLKIDLHNPTQEPQLLAPPFVHLLDADGQPIPPFFLAFNQPPTLPPGTSTKTELTYWLDDKQLSGSLTLHVGDKIAKVKEADSFDLKAIDNQASQTFDTTRWTN